MISIALHFACNYPNHSPLHLWPPRHPSICGFYIYSHSLDPSLAAAFSSTTNSYNITITYYQSICSPIAAACPKQFINNQIYLHITAPTDQRHIDDHNLHELLLCYEQKPMSCHHQHHCRHCATKRPANDNNSMN